MALGRVLSGALGGQSSFPTSLPTLGRVSGLLIPFHVTRRVYSIVAMLRRVRAEFVQHQQKGFRFT